MGSAYPVISLDGDDLGESDRHLGLEVSCPVPNALPEASLTGGVCGRRKKEALRNQRVARGRPVFGGLEVSCPAP